MGTPLHAMPASAREVLRRLPWVMLPAAALPLLTYVVPGLNPFEVSHHIDLTGALAVAAYWVAESGSPRGIPLIGIALTAILVSRSGITWKHRAEGALGEGCFLLPRSKVIERLASDVDPH